MIAIIILKFFLLIVLLGSSAFESGRSLLRSRKHFILPFAVIAVFLLISYYARMHFLEWQANELTKYLLPPLNPDGWGYSAFYVFMRFYAQYVAALVLAYVLIWAMTLMNRRHGERFFHTEEPYLAAAGVFLAGFPGLLYMLVMIIFVYLLAQLIVTAYKREAVRITTYYLWLPAALIASACVYFYSWQLPMFDLLKISGYFDLYQSL